MPAVGNVLADNEVVVVDIQYSGIETPGGKDAGQILYRTFVRFCVAVRLWRLPLSITTGRQNDEKNRAVPVKRG